ncbi:MAG: dihydrodipicolinate synthase family protein [Planctomycetaceae bacterium]|jgi:dihydrodipicolinate synthase/N-acetylneuraminate lyase|nr:dihydrodipicolinate synthase family protein [Planctomycetaceae bacterium]MBP62136.1 dihydrodipicolinate synthase family protein [Planctomycetaceae bacterium]
MQTNPVSPTTLASSVIAVPPLARNADFSLNHQQNARIIRYLEAGGVTTLLYGGNAALAHITQGDYAQLLALLVETAADSSLVIPSVGPTYGMMMDQAVLLREFAFPTVMVLPTRDGVTSDGVATGVRRFVEALGRPAVLYIKYDGYIEVDAVRRLVEDKLLSGIKYAIEQDDPLEDHYLKRLVDAVGSQQIVSGMGEQPAVAHMRHFQLAGFTSGCVCVAPRLSTLMLRALQTGDYDRAEQIRGTFRPLEDLRTVKHPVRVLHAAVALAGVAQTGPLPPLLSEVDPNDVPQVQAAARELLEADG